MHKFLLCLLFTFSCTLGYTYAPVVDESENFAINSTHHEPENQQALAHDDTANNSYFGDTNKPSYTNNSNEIAKLLNQIQDLQQTVQELRGQIDNQNHTIETLKNQQITLYKDLDERISKMNVPHTAKAPIENTKPNPPAVPIQVEQPKPQTINSNTASTTTALNPADEQISYMAAYNFVEKKEFKKAELALQEFIQHYPQSGYTPNAEYWLGEVYLQQKNYSAAMAHFENVVNNFQSSNKHAASLYKLGISLAENGQTADAKMKYQSVIQQYPDSDTAKLAQEQLNKL